MIHEHDIKIQRQMFPLSQKPNEQKYHLMTECDCCGSWYHSTCQDLSKTEANLISDGEEKCIRWFCRVCEPELIIKTSNPATATDEKLDATSESTKESKLGTINPLGLINNTAKYYSQKLKLLSKLSGKIPTM